MGPQRYSPLVRARAAQQGAQPRQQLFHVKGLGQVVIRARVNARHLLVPGAAGRENEHRHAAPHAAPVPQHRQPVHARQAQIQHGGVKRLHIAQVVRLLAVGRFFHRVPGGGNGLHQLPAQRGFVFHNEDAHLQSFLDFCLTLSTAPLAASTSSFTTRPSACSRRIS